jgi:beta-galactosidase
MRMTNSAPEVMLLAITRFCLVTVMVSLPASAQVNKVVIDASAPSLTPSSGNYSAGTSTSPGGHKIGINSQYLSLDDEPWLPVMGEFHFSRVPETEWEEEILKMKAAGVQIVATYVIWIHHEETEGKFDWSGRRDLRRFVQLCAEHGMYAVVRIGPWAHGEARNGGFPDWLLEKAPTRRTDPIFMKYVAQYYAQIAQQLKGLLWKDGGPVIGIQLENEYAGRGPEQGEEYILALKRLALLDGLDVPLYTVTGWDNAVVPKGQVLPVFGGYPDAPWDSSTLELPPNEVYLFRFGSRVAGNMGMIAGLGGTRPEPDSHDTPFITAEIGGGIQDTYHRRPIVHPDDVAAIMPVMLGSGVNLYGTYMFQGGQNPDGKLSTLQESQATGYPTDVPEKSYDFQAPLDPFGTERESFRKLKVFNYFLDDFGQDLAPMSVHAPLSAPKTPADFSVIRASVRSKGQQGFLFVNNYVRGAVVPTRKAVQFEIRLPGSTLNVPAKPVDVPSGAYFIWPFRFNLGGITLRYGTAQLFTRLKNPGGETFVFAETPGIPTELVLDDAPGLIARAEGATVRRQDGAVVITRISTGLDHTISLRRGSGPEVRLIVLTQAEAENAWKASIGNESHIVETEQDFFADESQFVLQSQGMPRCRFSVYPDRADELKSAQTKLAVHRSNKVAAYTGSVPEKHPVLRLDKIQDAGMVPPVKLGPPLSWRPQGVAMAPDGDAFHAAAKWKISIAGDLFDNAVSNVFLNIDYIGDVGRLSANGHLLDDNFYNGLPWSIGLRRFTEQIRNAQLELIVLPLRKDSPVFLEKQFRPDFKDAPQIERLNSLTLVPQYHFVIRAESRANQ